MARSPPFSTMTNSAQHMDRRFAEIWFIYCGSDRGFRRSKSTGWNRIHPDGPTEATRFRVPLALSALRRKLFSSGARRVCLGKSNSHPNGLKLCRAAFDVSPDSPERHHEMVKSHRRRCQSSIGSSFAGRSGLSLFIQRLRGNWLVALHGLSHAGISCGAPRQRRLLVIGLSHRNRFIACSLSGCPLPSSFAKRIA